MRENLKTEKKSRPIQCVVTSAKMERSRVGTIEHLVKHEAYGKFLGRRTKMMFHDENNETQVGDKVLIIQTRPISARKRFKLLKVLEKAAE